MIGTNEVVLIFLAVILLFGASKLPELARSLGKATGEFKKAQRASELELQEFESSVRNQPASERSPKIKKMAEELGIDTFGKSDDQLLEEIHAKMSSPQSEKVQIRVK